MTDQPPPIKGQQAIDSEHAARVLDTVDRREPEIVELLRRLVRVPSETHPPGGDEKEAQLVVKELFGELDLEVDLFEPSSVNGIEEHPGWWPGLDYRDRPNVVGVYPGTGGGRALILNGHIDVVAPGPREDWSVDPYGGAMRDGRIYGRGAVDMKGGIAAMAMALSCVLEAGFEPLGRVMLESVVNEELGGFNGTLACCVKGYEGDAAIVTEPTGMNIVAATKGGQTYRATLSGVPVHHGWWWKGVSALDMAVSLKAALVRWEEVRASEPSPSPLHADEARFPRPALADTVWYLRAGDPAVMSTPGEAELAFWVDVLPNEDREDVLARFEEHMAGWARNDPLLRDRPPRLERAMMRPFAGASIPLDHPIIDSLAEGHQRATGRDAQVTAGPAANDAMTFNLFSSTPAVVYGPGTTLTAHSPDEHIEIAELIAGTKALALAIMAFCDYRPSRSGSKAS
jgi:acetylornithine deacetylase